MIKKIQKMIGKYEYKTFSKNEKRGFFESRFHPKFAPIVLVQDKNNFQQKKIFKKNKLQKKEN